MKYVPEEIRKLLREIKCPGCGMSGGDGLIEKDGPHFAKVQCSFCRRWLDWIAFPKTDDEEKRERKRSRRYVTRLGEERCEICLRHKDQLPTPQKLEVQHVIEKAAGGADEPSNFRLYCSACHSFVNWIRTHFGHYHLKDEG